MSSIRHHRRTLASIAVALAAVVAGCGSSTASVATNAAGEKISNDAKYPVTVTADNGDVTLDAQPRAIISLSPTATEMIYAIGAGAQVAGVEEYSNYPAEAASKKTKLSGYDPNVEAIAAYKPDLVLISNDMSGVQKRLNALGIKVWMGQAATTLDDVYGQITELGQITGHVKQSKKLVASMKKDITEAFANFDPATTRSYYYELDNTYYSLTSNTFIGSLLKPLGLVSIADGVQAGNDYPQLNAESIISKNPDFIFLADTKCCAQTAATVAARPGWNAITAVTANKVVELDDDVASRWGPRVVDLVKQLAAAVNGK